jgi:hypothetical protein
MENNNSSIKVLCNYYGQISAGFVFASDAVKCNGTLAAQRRGREADGIGCARVWVGDNEDLGNGNFWPALAVSVVR